MRRAGELLLAAILILWQPLGFAATAGRTIPSLGFRGWIAAIELVVTGFAAALSVAAAWSLWNRAPHAVPLARFALILSTARTVQSLYWTRLPSDVVPGTERILTAFAVAHAGAWLIYLSRARRADAVG